VGIATADRCKGKFAQYVVDGPRDIRIIFDDYYELLAFTIHKFLYSRNA